MANNIRIKRRISGGAGAPSALKSAELAHNETDDTIYIGKGDDGGGNATSILAVAGKGAFADLSSAQTIGGAKAFSISPTAPTPTAGDNTTKVATTAFVQTAVSGGGDGNQSANTVKAGPTSGGAAAPTYRSLVVNDIPSLTANKISDFDAQADSRIAAQKGANNGIASLDGAGKVPASQLPAFVDDVLEFADLAGFPGTGTSSIIYVAQDSNKAYRWSGSAYVEISASPGSTDSVAEGTTNKYFTEARVLASVLAGLSTASSAVATAADSVLSALGKLQAQVSARLVAANNLSDLGSAATARTNLGLGTMATQNANAVAITGGSIDGVTIDGGTF